MAKGNGTSLLLIGGIAAAIYYYRAQIEAELATLGISGAAAGGTTSTTSTSTGAPIGAQTTNMSPIGAQTQASFPIGPNGCYVNLPSGNVTCPPGVSPPAGSGPAANCQAGYYVDANGVCQLTTQFGGGPIPITAQPVLSLKPVGSRRGALPGVSTRAALHGLRGLAGALPMTNALLIEASHNPNVAAVVSSDPRAQLTVPQWNYFYAQASGQLQTAPTHPSGDPGVRINAAQYQMLRSQSGLPVRLGTLRPARAGAFPLGGIRDSTANTNTFTPWTFKGNRNIYRVPGQGAVTGAVRHMGVIADGGGDHRWSRSPFPRSSWWREAE